jgi:hypothetical protein
VTLEKLEIFQVCILVKSEGIPDTENGRKMIIVQRRTQIYA